MNAERTGLTFLNGLFLGVSIVATRVGLRDISPLYFVFSRLLIATLLFIVLLLVLRKKLPTDARIWRDIVIVGVLATSAPLLLSTLSLQFLSSGVFTIFLSLIPLVTALLAHNLADEFLTLPKIAGLVLAFGGVLLMLVTRTSGLTTSAGSADLRGPIMALGVVLLAAFGTVFARVRLQKVDVSIVTAGQFAIALLAITPFTLAFSSIDIPAISTSGWLALSYSGLIGSFASFYLFYYMVKRFGATVAGLSTYVAPVVSIILGAITLGEIITLPLLAGASLVLVGVFLSSR